MCAIQSAAVLLDAFAYLMLIVLDLRELAASLKHKTQTSQLEDRDNKCRNISLLRQLN